MDSVIVVHGTFAGLQDGTVQWFQPGSNFCAALDRELARRGLDARCWRDIEAAGCCFHWSPGDNTWIARLDAAERLRAFLQRHSGPHHIVAHSHGGNVVLDALGWTSGAPDGWFSGTVTLLGTPILRVGRRHVSYTVGAWVLIVIAMLAGALRSPSLGVWHGLALVGLVAALFIVRAVRQLEILGPSFAIRILEPEPSLLVINSERDEAYQLLNNLTTIRNPLNRPWPTRPRDILRSVRSGVAGAIRNSALAANASCHRAAASLHWPVTVIAVLWLGAVTGLATRAGASTSVLYWATIGLTAGLVALTVMSRAALDGLTYLHYIVNVAVAFAWKLARYPVSALITWQAKRAAWPLLQSYALGFVDSPTPLSSVRVELRPSRIDAHEFIELPGDLVARAIADRNASAKREVAAFIDSLSATNWSIDAVQSCLSALNAPGLVHSSYYTYLDDGRIIDAIATHIERYERAVRKEAEKMSEEMYQELTNRD